MQMQCLTESGNTFSYMEQKLEWADDIKERLSGMNPEDFMAYLQEPMETYAHQQGAVFSKMYTAARAEKGEIPGLLREEEAIAYQAGGAAFESSDYYTTRAIREYGSFFCRACQSCGRHDGEKTTGLLGGSRNAAGI